MNIRVFLLNIARAMPVLGSGNDNKSGGAVQILSIHTIRNFEVVSLFCSLQQD